MDNPAKLSPPLTGGDEGEGILSSKFREGYIAFKTIHREYEQCY
jgi:hypothetical protein